MSDKRGRKDRKKGKGFGLARDRAELCHLLFDSIDAGFCVIELEFDEIGRAVDYWFVEINKAFEQQTGLENALGKSIRGLRPKHEQHWFDVYGHVAQTGEPARFEHQAAALHRWYDVYAFRIGEPEERLVAILFNDITEKKITEEALARSEQRLQLAIKIAELGTFNIDLLTDAVQVNETGRAIYGWEPEASLTFSKVQTYFHPDDKEYVLQEVRNALDPAGAGEFEVEQRIIREDATVRWIRVRGRVIFEQADGGRVPVECIGTYLDITEEKEHEQTLRDNEERLKSIMESAQDFAIFTLDLRGMVTSWNTGAHNIFRYAPEDIIGRSGNILFTPEDRQNEAPEQEQEDAVTEGRASAERWHMRHDGTLFFASGILTPLRNGEGEIQGYLKVLRDITEQQRLKEQREKLLELEQAARAEAEHVVRMKDEFLATLSHELRTPLNAIYGWAQLLKTGKLDADEFQHGVEVIERNAKVQAQLIDDLLDISRIISGKVRLDLQQIELGEVIAAAVESVAPTAEAKGVRVETFLDAGQGRISGDPARLQQVFWNLLANATKFTPRGGKITVTLEHTGSQAKVTVTDTGQGIKPEFLPHVFDRFSQADASITRRHGGLGLGLSIVRQLVEMHNGTVEAASAGEGLGATFVVTMPLSSVKPYDVKTGREKLLRDSNRTICDTSLEGLKILVLEDDDDARDLVRRILEGCEAKVRIAADAEEGFEAFSHERFDLVVSDISMPNHDGYEFIRRVRALGDRKGGSVPAVALTALARPEDRERALKTGYQMHVSKPVEPEQLVAAIATLAGRKH